MASMLARSLTLVILSIVIGLLAFDVKEHGSFKASKTHKFLVDSGALHYGGVAWSNLRSYSQQGYSWCAEHCPVYLAKARETAKPVLHVALDWLSYLVERLLINLQLIYGYILEKKPLVEQWINKYAPGLIDAASTWFWQASTTFLNGVLVVVEFLLTYFTLAVDWLMKNVFVGSLSPENLQKYTLDALNTTSRFAIQTLSWLNDKFVTVTSSS